MPSITKTNRIHLVLFGMQNRTFGPYLAANDKILISLMQAHATERVRCPRKSPLQRLALDEAAGHEAGR
jgi:hypothetical protein